MRIIRGKFSMILFVLLAIFIFSSSSVLADTYIEPYVDYDGSFSYNQCDIGKPSDDCQLVFDFTSSGGAGVSQVTYVDGSWTKNPAIDPIIDAYFVIAPLYNDPSYASIFSGTQPSGGSTGPVSFTITDGSTIYLTATLDNFMVDTSNYTVNYSWTLDNINVTSWNLGSSNFIDQLNQSVTTYNNPVNLEMEFTFLEGSNFSNDSSGTVQGKLAVTPEPVSSILFMAGGATLFARRYLRKKKKTS